MSKDVFDRLNIADYKERIFRSNSHGELFHLMDYQQIANTFKDLSWFRNWFISVVNEAEEKWDRPESVFQHIVKILLDNIDAQKNAESGGAASNS